jgi:LruC domain-containing protein
MKTFKFKLSIAMAVVSTFSITSCIDKNNNDINAVTNLSSFDYKTTKDINVTVTTLNNSNQPISGVQVKLFTQNPFNEDGTLKANCSDFLIYTGTTNSVGELRCKISPATTVDSVSIYVNQIGLTNLQIVKLTSSDLIVQIGGSIKPSNSKVKSLVTSSLALPTPATVSGFLTLGTWSNQGVPNYLSLPNDVVDNSLLTDINATLPEYTPLTVSHPQYLTNSNDGSVKLYEDAAVWVTFVHEGAGYMNTLAYYTYPNGNPPATIQDIKDKTVLYPNVSFSGSGGGLTSGNKVQLLYYNQLTKTYSATFPAGTSVAWIINANGWTGSALKTTNTSTTYYSDSKFNPETDPTLKKHNVVLNDAQRKLLLIGFEDLRRDQGSDNDFNDAVFYATTNPYTAIQPTQYLSIDKPIDTDGDGVTDASDDYPTDPTKAHNNYYPADAKVGTLAYEDLWPYKGDYDFNDLVVDYNFNQITNGQNKVTEIEAQLTVRAIGASYKNGFGIEFNTTPDNVLSVSGQNLSEGIINLNSNGTEKNQDNAVVIAFDNAYKVLPHIGNSIGVNTVSGETYQTPHVLNLKVLFKNPVAYSDFGTPPYNPFIFINGDRSKEVHLPASPPTNLADLRLFGTGQDNSDVSKNKYYVSDKYLPWALNIPTKFDYPAEKNDITQAYLGFNRWVASKGINNMDWYLNLKGYRDATKIFSK